ncbi:protein of unknown function [Serratia sp. Tan611]|nr:protein of unknown function [Serratia sp. Tan611]
MLPVVITGIKFPFLFILNATFSLIINAAGNAFNVVLG